MSYFELKDEDLIHTFIVAHPRSRVSSFNFKVTGSVYLEESLRNEIQNKRYDGYSERLGGYSFKFGPITASINLDYAVYNGTNKELYQAVSNFYQFYSIKNYDYNIRFSGTNATNLRIINIPQVYYDGQILTGTFSGTDYLSGTRRIFDNGRGGVYLGSDTGSLVGNIFYEEGIVALKDPKLFNFGEASGSYNWNFDFRGVHKIPVKIIRCRAPAGELNFSTNPTFVVTSSLGDMVCVMPNQEVYVSSIGIFNEEFQLVAVANLNHPVRVGNRDVQFRLRIDF